MIFILGILILIIMMLILYITILQHQMSSINKQLDKRQLEGSRSPITIQLVNKELNQLTNNINQCFKAEETLRLKGVREEKRFKELIANLSHDLRTPLTAIKGYLQLIEKGELDSNQRNKLDIALERSKELGQLIEHFFEYSYLINTEPKLNIKTINLTQLVEEALIASITELEARNLKVQLEEDTPQVYIKGDKEVCSRIIENLIRNGIQHSSGEIEIKINQGEAVVLSFVNPVCEPLDIDVTKLFDRFYTGNHSRTKSTGLGLSIVKLLAEQMDGAVEGSITGNLLEIKVKFRG